MNDKKTEKTTDKEKTMFIGYRNGNVGMVNGGIRLKLLAMAAWLMGIKFHVEGIPFGR